MAPCFALHQVQCSSLHAAACIRILPRTVALTALALRRPPTRALLRSLLRSMASGTGSHAGASPSHPIKSVAIIVALTAEAEPLIKALNLSKDETGNMPGPAPCFSHSGTYAGLKVYVICNGPDKRFGVDNVGTGPAGLTSYLALLTFKPDLLITSGTAGGFKAQGAAIADVFLGTKFINHDRRNPIPGYDKYGFWECDALPTPNLQKALSLKAGVVSTGNSLDYVDKDMEIMVENKAAVKEMEANAIAWVASMFGTPLIALKAVTDIVDGDRPTGEEFLENLGKTVAALTAKVGPVLEFISGKRIEEL